MAILEVSQAPVAKEGKQKKSHGKKEKTQKNKKHKQTNKNSLYESIGGWNKPMEEWRVRI